MNETLLSAQLKQHTLTSHQQLEKALIGQIRQINSPEMYVTMLQLFYSYFGALEDYINQNINSVQLSDYPLRRKTESILQDLKTFNGTKPEKTKIADLPVITNNLQAFGALYVIEGSTLGGQIISKMIMKQLNLTDSKGLSFFSSYGDQTPAMWASFKTALNRQAQNKEEEMLLINAADDTFVKFKYWIEKQESNR
ncbi:MAG: biliverdin-producing heme oxygenase [Janthinobacterium lividum]